MGENDSKTINAVRDFGDYVVECWVSEMIKNLDTNQPIGNRNKLIKNCSIAHYNAMDMDSVINSYKGKIEDFISFLESEWGWKVSYDRESMTILADENKNYCVCPLVKKGITNSPIMCNCSEGIAEKMFSGVMGMPAKAEVVRSVLRGDKSCVYKICF